MQRHQHVQENLSHKDFLILACLVEEAKMATVLHEAVIF
jgi:hypothetical protein